MRERLQKIMAQSGMGSRRECEVIISDGRVHVNGKIAVVGDKADISKDKIIIDGNPINLPDNPIYIKVYKPHNVISSTKSQDERKNVRDLVPIKGFLYPVGRLDHNSEGLILLTNDGELANRITHPRFECEKEYQIQVGKFPSVEQLNIWRRGLVLRDGFRTSPAQLRIIKKEGTTTWLSIILKEGHKHQIREMGHSTNLPVLRIIRIRIGPLVLGNLKAGQWRHLTEGEIKELRNETINSETS